VLTLGSLVWLLFASLRKRETAAFAASSLWLASLLLQAAVTLYPYLLPALPPGRGGISIFSAAPSPVALGSALVVTIVGLIAVCVYGTLVLRDMAGKLVIEE